MDNFRTSIRVSNLNDLADIIKLFKETIAVVCKDDYSPEQLKVWTSSTENPDRWIDKIKSHYLLVAELDKELIGIASLDNRDYIDLLFVHKDYQRKGIANRLYSEIENEAIKRKITSLYADVSITAKLFFQKIGYEILKEQKNNKEGVEIINYKMKKQLSNSNSL
ncbi:GNAT family N-acetyltransferase [Anditalea andensis]|uniref:N-acetyltransferase domain-containing protein n=1 Tax=Anditalea andensis TaxID=1048983 RepID=A0A074KW95_9BACT|nr:GNAT family N-acetyltransferase [Anditalea andensis]KEO71888.1 hypothetical protein EL17_20420 [Anditalea andensis]